jgi:hypothetical protein
MENLFRSLVRFLITCNFVDFCDLYSSPNIIWVITSKNKIGRACGSYETQERYNRVLMGRSEVTTPLGRHRLRWENNIKIGL